MSGGTDAPRALGPRARALMRLRGFLRKEVLQIARDPSSIALAIVMPVVLIFLFGYGVSLDAEHVPIAIVLDDPGPEARDLAGRFELSPYFEPVRATSLAEADRMMARHDVEGILRVDADFSDDLHAGGAVPVQLLLRGVDSNRARLVQSYAGGVAGTWSALRRARGEAAAVPAVRIVPRTWFNTALRSTDFLVPGLVALIMTLTGTLLTALVIAREWERGTMEAILVTPLRPGEFLLSKILPYYGLGMAGLFLAVGLGRLVFDVPVRGSFASLVLLSSLFLLAALGVGLVISANVRIQFVAAQISVVAGFLPTFFLSGLLFDLGSTPLPVRLISYAIPARYYVSASHTLFLAGDVWSVLLPDALALLLMATILIGIARARVGTRLEG